MQREQNQQEQSRNNILELYNQALNLHNNELILAENQGNKYQINKILEEKKALYKQALYKIPAHINESDDLDNSCEDLRKKVNYQMALISFQLGENSECKNRKFIHYIESYSKIITCLDLDENNFFVNSTLKLVLLAQQTGEDNSLKSLIFATLALDYIKDKNKQIDSQNITILTDIITKLTIRNTDHILHNTDDSQAEQYQTRQQELIEIQKNISETNIDEALFAKILNSFSQAKEMIPDLSETSRKELINNIINYYLVQLDEEQTKITNITEQPTPILLNVEKIVEELQKIHWHDNVSIRDKSNKTSPYFDYLETESQQKFSEDRGCNTFCYIM